jgi:rubrerythrin
MENQVSKQKFTKERIKPFSKQEFSEENIIAKTKFVRCDSCNHTYDLNKKDQCPNCGKFKTIGLVGDGKHPLEYFSLLWQ